MTDIAAVDGTPTGAPQTTGTDAAADNKPEVDPKVTAFINSWVDRIKAAKKTKKTENAFKRMDECMQLAKDGAEKTWMEGGKNYVVPILNRLTNQSVAQLYAKNPKAYAKRKMRRMFTVWDGKLASLQEAKMMLQASAAMPPQIDPMTGQEIPPQLDPNAMAIIADAEKVKEYDRMMDGVADTLTILHNHFLQDPAAQYKQQFKAAVRRTKVCSVSYAKLSYQRILEHNADASAKLNDATEKLAVMKRLIAEAARDELPEESAEMEQLRTLIDDLGQQTTLLVQEGPVLSFPRSKKIIIDPACHQLKTLAGAGWYAEEYDDKTPTDIEEIWGVDIGGQYTEYKPENSPDSWSRWSEKAGDLKKESAALVWRVMNKKTGQEFVICEGYKDYIKPPAPPSVKLTRFWDIFPLVFNEIESEDDLYPPSDVWNAKHLQNEYNRSRQGLREHRLANRPGYVAGKGTFEEGDLNKFESHPTAAILEINRPLSTNEKIGDLLQAKPVMQIDPKQYEVDGIWQDILRTTGQQQANAGPTSGATATESSIAEHSNQLGVSDSVDDIDEWLSMIVQAAGQAMLTEMSKETVIGIVGPGAVWPDLPETREEIAESISLDVRAGSSGRPNAGEDLRKMQTAMPVIIQIPGINPTPFGQKYVELLDIDIEGAMLEGMPSIAAINAMMSKPPAPSAPGEGDPKAQGGHGGDNAPRPPGAPPAPGPSQPHDHAGQPIPT